MIFWGQAMFGDSGKHIYPLCPAGHLWVKHILIKGKQGEVRLLACLYEG